MHAAAYLGFVWAAALGAGTAPFVKATVDSTSVGRGSSFLIRIEARGGDIKEPEIPDVDGLVIDKHPQITEDQFHFSLGGGRGASMVRGYVARATRTGKITIPPIVVRVDGQELRTEPIELMVTEAPASVRPPPNPSRIRGENFANDQADSPESALTWDEAVFTTSDVDKKEVFVGEPVRLTLSLWVIESDSVQAGTPPGARIQYPTTEGFYALEREPRVNRQTRDGRQYQVRQYQQILYPTVPGELTIGSWHWEGFAQALTRIGIQTREYDRQTPPITILVKPLPDQPANFSGAVGDFVLEAKLSRYETMQGTPIQLTLRLAGHGNPNAMGEPQLPSIPGVYISDPQKDTRPSNDAQGFSVEKTIAYSIAPVESNDLTIPEIEFCYFDPQAATYKTLKQGPFTVKVLRAPGQQRVVFGESVPSDKVKLDVVEESILPLIAAPAALRPGGSSSVDELLWLLLPPAGYVAAATLMARRRRFTRDTRYARAYYAKGKAHKRVRAAMKATDPSQELYRALVGFLADKFDVPEAGITSADVERLVGEKGVNGEPTESVLKILRACERERYAGAPLSRDEIEALAHAALKGMEDIEVALRRD
ncbi:MAG: BatD family protein [Candidatus Hydrogenedentes bacterium]|nr:BatD family protein [Candidatus Hydrogenedentota bacterium]